MADPVKVRVLYDTEEADKQLADFQDRVVAAFEQVGVDLTDAMSLDQARLAFQQLGGTATEELKAIQDATQKTADATEELLKMEQVDEAVGAMGDLKDIWEKMAGPVWGFNEAQVESVVLAGDLAEKGASLGKVFGAWGAVAGGVIGALIGWLIHANKEAQEAAQKVKDLEAEAKNAVNEFATLDEANLETVIGKVVELQTQLSKVTGATKLTQINLEILAKKSAKELGDEFDRLSRIALGDEFETQGKTLEELTSLLVASQKELEGFSSEAVGASKFLRELADTQGASGNLQQAYLDKYKALIPQIQSAQTRIAAYEKAISDLTPKIEKETEATKEQTKATKESADAFDKIGGVLLKVDKAREAASKQRLSNEQFADSILGGATSATAVTEGVIKLMETEKAKADRLVEFYETINDLPSLASIIGDVTELPTSEDRVLGGLEHTLGVTREIAIEIQSLGQTFASSIGGLAADSVDLLFERIASGQQSTRGALRGLIAQFLRETGTQLIADGTKNILIGTGRTLFGDPTGAAMVGLGGVELASGFAMGGVGAFAQRRAPEPPPEAPASGFSPTGNPSLGSSERAQFAPGGNISVSLIGNMFLEGNERGMAPAGEKLVGAINAHRRDLSLDMGV